MVESFISFISLVTLYWILIESFRLNLIEIFSFFSFSSFSFRVMKWIFDLFIALLWHSSNLLKLRKWNGVLKCRRLWERKKRGMKVIFHITKFFLLVSGNLMTQFSSFCDINFHRQHNFHPVKKSIMFGICSGNYAVLNFSSYLYNFKKFIVQEIFSFDKLQLKSSSVNSNKILMNPLLFNFLITAQIIEIIAVEGKSVSLQCPILGSDVAMVLWFKSTGGIPLYRWVQCSQIYEIQDFNYILQQLTHYHLFFSLTNQLPLKRKVFLVS